MKHIARVFPRKTKASPTDPLAFFGPPPMFLPEIEEVRVSVAFTWDLPHAEFLGRQWERIAPVKIGGPALNEPGDEFVPGRYLKPGYTITSRGCPNRCWFCSVWKREPKLNELEIKPGWNILDDNLLACSRSHIAGVFLMLHEQKRRAEFTGGLEAARLRDWHVNLLVDLRPKQMFFAYDTKDDLEPLRVAGQKLLSAGFTRASHSLRCYVLMGWKGDTILNAESRMRAVIDAGFTPTGMLYRTKTGAVTSSWGRFQRSWFRPAAIYSTQRKG